MSNDSRRPKLSIFSKNLASRVRQISFFRRKYVLLLILISIVGLLIFVNLGGSTTTTYDKKGEGVSVEDEAGQLDIPNQDAEGLPGGFNLSDGFSDIPSFSPPAGLAGQYGDSFGTTGDFGDISDIFGGGGNTGGGGFDPGQFDPGGFDPGNGGIDPPPVGGGDLPPIDPKPPSGGSGGNIGIPDPGDNSINNTPKNVSLPNRQVKARNLPSLGFIEVPDLSIKIPGLPRISLSVSSENSIYLLILGVSLYMNKAIVPSLIKKLEESEKNRENSIFVKPDKKRIEELRKKRERKKKLLRFKDHVDQLIKRSEERINKLQPSEVIVQGYHELDVAFNEFSQLTRRKDLTPLEHARIHFESGEISNEVLEKIVDLFYLTRFGLRELEVNDIYSFIGLLSELVIQGLSIDDVMN